MENCAPLYTEAVHKNIDSEAWTLTVVTECIPLQSVSIAISLTTLSEYEDIHGQVITLLRRAPIPRDFMPLWTISQAHLSLKLYSQNCRFHRL